MYLSTTRIVILVSSLCELITDDSGYSRWGFENIAEIRDKGEFLYEFIFYLLTFESCKPLKLHLEDRSCLTLRE